MQFQNLLIVVNCFKSIFVSSANFKIELVMLSISLIYIKKRVGPRTDPCGTPLVNSLQSEYVAQIVTLCSLLLSQSSIQFRVHPLIQ